MTDVFITVRTGSTRLPKKCLLPLGECSTVLEHVIRRCQHFKFKPIVCTTVHPSDDVLEQIADKIDVRVFRGLIENVEQRWLDCAKWHKIDRFHTIDCDDPFFCETSVLLSMKLAETHYHVLPSKESSDHGLGLMGHSFNLNAKDQTRFSDDDKFRWRVTLDYQEDYWLIATLARIYGYKMPRWMMDELASHLKVINHFRNEDWKANQCKTHSANTMAMN